VAPSPAASDPHRVAAFDPGRNIGYALVDGSGTLVEKRVLDLEDLGTLVLPPGTVVVIGNGTGSQALRDRLERAGHEVSVVDERGTTLEGRALWRGSERPRGLLRLLPEGLRAPGKPIDDYAAWAIALRYLRGRP